MELSEIKNFLVVLGLFLVIDLPWLTTINGPMYKQQFLNINKGPVNVSIRNWISAGIAYLLLAFGLYYFIIKPELPNPTPNYTKIFITGALLGLIIYGVYNGTNMTIINEWTTKVSIADTIWGTSLSGILSIGSLYIIKNFLSSK
jgi:uncharacterized membrane protein